MSYPYGEARALFTYGLMLAEQGETALARERLDAALTILSRLGERLYMEAAEHLLASVP
jgi:hypothetical protein